MEDEIKKQEEVSNVVKDIPGVEGQVTLRKFDTEDLIRLRDEGLETTVDPTTGKEKIKMQLGSMMKWNIILGVKSAPFFAKTITEDRGAAPVVNERLKEFRGIPPESIDALFNKIREYNSIDYGDDYAKK